MENKLHKNKDKSMTRLNDFFKFILIWIFIFSFIFVVPSHREIFKYYFEMPRKMNTRCHRLTLTEMNWTLMCL